MNGRTERGPANQGDGRRHGQGGLRMALAAVALLLMGSVIGGVVVAATTGVAKGIPQGIWKNQLEFGSNQLLVVFAVDLQGNIQPYFEKETGRPEKYEPVTDPIASAQIDIEIGNPKVCWTTSSGGKECVVY